METSVGQIVERLEETADGERMLRVLLPTMDALSEKIRQIPSGTTRGLDEIGAELARAHGADMACPAAMLRQLKVVAVIAHSSVAMKDSAAVPFWRIVGEGGASFGDKLAGGHGFSLAQRKKEQHGTKSR